MNYRQYEGKELLISRNASLEDIVRQIKASAKISATHPDVKQIANEIQGGQSTVIRMAFDSVYDRVIYTPTPPHQQNVRFGWRTLRDGKGNCVDYTILLSAILQNKGVPHKLRLVAWKPGRGYEHIYIVANGITLDPCQGQPQDGTATRENRSYSGKFNNELPFYSKKDIHMPGLSVLGSLNCAECSGGCSSCGTMPVESRRQIQMRQTGLTMKAPTRTTATIVKHPASAGTRVASYMSSRRQMAYASHQRSLGLLFPGDTTIVKNLLGDPCKRKCDIKYPFNKDKRQACKADCPALTKNQGIPNPMPTPAPAPAPPAPDDETKKKNAGTKTVVGLGVAFAAIKLLSLL